MSKQVLSGWAEDDKNIGLLFISSHLEDFRLAYAINKECSTHFTNITANKDTFEMDRVQSVSLFFTPVGVDYSRCYLVQNQRVLKNVKNASGTLFENSGASVLPLLKSYVKWPFFLLYAPEDSSGLIAKIRSLPVINAHQTVDFKALSKNDQNIIYNIYHED